MLKKELEEAYKNLQEKYDNLKDYMNEFLKFEKKKSIIVYGKNNGG